jgi:outer membrane protein X
MKKIFLSVFFAMIGMCVFAQKGDFAVGVNLGYAPVMESGVSLSNLGIGAKAQYNVTDPLRLEVGANYWLKSKEVSMFDLAVNAHYLIPVTEKIKIYPLVGVGYFHASGASGDDKEKEKELENYINSVYSGYQVRAIEFVENEEEEDEEVYGGGSDAYSKVLFNIGVGAEYALAPNLSVGAEVKYQYVKDFSRLPISIGITYKF